MKIFRRICERENEDREAGQKAHCLVARLVGRRQLDCR